ncbi:MAG: LysM peptidoglycan-binding domain-containing protein [Bacteroidales bacterium]
MIKKLSIILSFLVFILPNTSAISQNYVTPPVEISQEIVKINNNTFYIHKVLKKQTLYSISKKYQISLAEIQKNNKKTLKKGLIVGMLLYIPTNKNLPKTSITGTIQNIQGTTQDKQISVIKDDIDTVIIEKGRYEKHKVRWYETIEDVADKYDVSVESIILLNRLKESKVHKRQKLYIPDAKFIEENFNNKKEKPLTESLFEPQDNAENELNNLTSYVNSENYKYNERTYHIAFVLPINMHDSIKNASSFMIDFYSGVQLAIKDLQYHYDLSRYRISLIDMSDYSDIYELVNSRILDDCELIVGPINPQDLQVMAEFGLKHRIPIVSPLDYRTKDLCINNPYFFQYPTTMESTQDSIVKHINLDSHITIISEKDINDSATDYGYELFNQKHILYDSLCYNKLGDENTPILIKSKLDTLKKNSVYVLSESNTFVTDALRNLKAIGTNDSISITVYGQPKWANLKNIEQKTLHILNTHLYCIYYTDYHNPNTINFVKNYVDIYKCDPSKMAIQGYDITTYFMSALSEYGREFPIYLNNFNKSLIQSDIHFISKSYNNGFINTATRNIIYLPKWKMWYSHNIEGITEPIEIINPIETIDSLQIKPLDSLQTSL